ncbi:MAG: VWA domain-containing protein [Bacteroidota bacterium]
MRNKLLQPQKIFPFPSLTLFSLLLLAAINDPAWAQPRTFYEHWRLNPPATATTQSFGQGGCYFGDLEGDGVPEIVVAEQGESSPRLWCLSLTPDGTVAKTRDIKLTALDVGNSFGQRMEALGDWDGDGIPDLAVSEPGATLGRSAQAYGCFWILLLQQNGQLKEAIKINARVPNLLGKVGRNIGLGMDLAVVGDVDGNGQKDLAVGAPGKDGKTSGQVFLLLMKNTQEVESVHDLGASHADLMAQLKPGDQFGFTVEALGDLDQNGEWDLAVGAPSDDASGQDQGALYLLSMPPQGSVSTWKKVVNDQGGFNVFLNPDDRWASSLAFLPDWTSDSALSRGALVTGVYKDDDGRKDQGAMYVLDLWADMQIGGQHKISATTPNFEGELRSRQDYQWGLSLSPSPDLDGNGRAELLVNGQQHQSGGAYWVLRPAEWPDRLKDTLQWAAGAFQISAADSARIYAQASNAADSARIDSLYDLSAYAPSHLIFLLDVSASMSESTKLPLLKDAFINLLPFLRPEDKVSIITYSGKPSIQLAAVAAEERTLITKTLDALRSSGETKPRKALEMAYELAEDQFIPNGNNRIIFATDGGFEFAALDRPLEKLARTEVPLSVFYFGKLARWQITELQTIAQRGYGRNRHITNESVNEALLREIKMISKRQ